MEQPSTNITSTLALNTSTAEELSTLFDECIQEFRTQCNPEEQDQLVSEWFDATQCKIMKDIQQQCALIFSSEVVLKFKFGLPSYDTVMKTNFMALPAWIFHPSNGISIYTSTHPAALVHYCDVIKTSLIRLLSHRGFDASIGCIIEGNSIYYEIVVKFRDSAYATPRQSNSTIISSLSTSPSCAFPCNVHHLISSSPWSESGGQDCEVLLEEAPGSPKTHNSSETVGEQAPDSAEALDDWSSDQDYAPVLEEAPCRPKSNDWSESDSVGESPEALDDWSSGQPLLGDAPTVTELGITDHILAIRHLLLSRARTLTVQHLDLVMVVIALNLVFIAVSFWSLWIRLLQICLALVL